MAKILDFVRRPAAPAPRRAAPRSTPCSQDFSIEVMPRTAAKIADFRAILPAGTRVYLAHIDGTDFAEMLADRPPPRGRGLRRHAALPGPRHRQPRPSSTPASPPTPTPASARRWSSPAASTARAAPSPRRCSCSRTGRLRRPRLHRTCTSPATRRATATSTPPAATPSPWPRSPRKAAFAARDRRRDGDRHPVLSSRPRPVIAWADRLAAAGITLPRPHRRRRPRQAADADPLRHDLRRRPEPARAAAPRRRPDQAHASLRADRVLAELAAHKAAEPGFAIERVHFFPLGGIAATTDYTGAVTARPRAGALA